MARRSRFSPRERGDILRRAFELVTANTDRLAAIMTAEMGKPLAEARGEVAYGAEMLRWFSEEAVRIGGDSATSLDGNTRIMITKEPIGPCVLVTPWNFPLAMGARKIGPCRRRWLHHGLQASGPNAPDIPCPGTDFP